MGFDTIEINQVRYLKCSFIFNQDQAEQYFGRFFDNCDIVDCVKFHLVYRTCQFNFVVLKMVCMRMEGYLTQNFDPNKVTLIPHTKITNHKPHITHHIPHTIYHIPHTTYHILYTTYHVLPPWPFAVGPSCHPCQQLTG